MYIFNSFYLLHSCNLSFLICLCFNMVCFRGEKKAWATPRSVSFRGLIQKVRRASPPLSYEESPPGIPPSGKTDTWSVSFRKQTAEETEKKKNRGVIGSSLVWLFIVSDTMLSLKCYYDQIWEFVFDDIFRKCM